jgi:predicted nucleic acid-binding protein
VRSIYVDSNILISYYSVHRTEQRKKAMVQNALDIFERAADVVLCTSEWAQVEMVNILTSSMKMSPGVVAGIERSLHLESFGKLKLKFLPVSPVPDYGFSHFFHDVRLATLAYHCGVGDVIHSVIMKNYGIDYILTFDEKDDFKQIPGLTVFHPKDIRL